MLKILIDKVWKTFLSALDVTVNLDNFFIQTEQNSEFNVLCELFDSNVSY